MRKLLLPETGKIMQRNVPSHLPEHLAVTQPDNSQAVERDLFLEESLSSTACKRCLGSKIMLLRGPPTLSPALLCPTVRHVCPHCSPMGDDGSGLLRDQQWPQDPITGDEGGDDLGRSEDKLQFFLPCAWLRWVQVFKQQGRSKWKVSIPYAVFGGVGVWCSYSVLTSRKGWRWGRGGLESQTARDLLLLWAGG